MGIPAKHRQSGIALVTVLFIVTLASISATALLVSQNLAIHRSSAILSSDKAWWYSVGVENWVTRILEQDAEESDYDHLGEPWAYPVDFLPVEGGFISGQLTDQHARININGLVGQNEQASAEEFQRLIESIDDDAVRQLDARALIQQIQDWIDEDINPRIPGGAEDDYYLGLEQPYRTANQVMHSVSELMLMPAMTRKAYNTLTPYLTALPQQTRINVNTAPALIFMALIPGMSLAEAEHIVTERDETPYANVSEFLQSESMAGREIDENRITVNSEYFMVQVVATIDRSRSPLYSLVHRQRGKARVIAHSRNLY